MHKQENKTILNCMSSQVKIHAHFEVMYHHKLVSVDIPILLTITGYLTALLATGYLFTTDFIVV